MINVHSQLFFNVYEKIYGEEARMVIENNIDIEKLEETLKNFLTKITVYKNNYIGNSKEIEIMFENIFANRDKYSMGLIAIIEEYGSDYVTMLNDHPYTQKFLIAANNIYSESFDIKHDGKEDSAFKINVAIKNIGKRIDIIRAVRIDEESFPSIVIRNIDTFEETLKEYIEAIKNGNSWYNIFDRDGFCQRGEDENIKMILEAALVNATNIDARDIEVFFKNYTSYVLNEDLGSLRNLQKVGRLFDDDLYIMLKRSELWYETPFYISLMLCNKHIELPNVRLGIDFEKKCANIIAVQSSQVQNETQEFIELKETIKRVLPKDSYYRFINPSHVISLVITMGYLKAIGINEVLLKDYMPFRYKKVVYDKHLDEDEAEKLQTRLTTKNIATFLRISSNIDGINVMSYPGNSSELKLSIADEIHGKNQFIEDLFKLGYDLGQKNKCENTRKLKLD